jgi:hypothetical protein
LLRKCATVTPHITCHSTHFPKAIVLGLASGEFHRIVWQWRLASSIRFYHANQHVLRIKNFIQFLQFFSISLFNLEATRSTFIPNMSSKFALPLLFTASLALLSAAHPYPHVSADVVGANARGVDPFITIPIRKPSTLEHSDGTFHIEKALSSLAAAKNKYGPKFTSVERKTSSKVVPYHIINNNYRD